MHPLPPVAPGAGWAEWSSWLGPDGAPAFTAEECDELVAIADDRPERCGTIGFDGRLDPATRTVDIVDVPPSLPTAMWLYRKLETIARDVNDTFWRLDFTHMDNVEVLRYQPGGHYRPHVDWTQGLTTRKLSIVVMLSDPADYEGGELLLHSRAEPYVAPRERGSIVLFPSWTLHGVQPVTAGERRVATCWVHGPPYR